MSSLIPPLGDLEGGLGHLAADGGAVDPAPVATVGGDAVDGVGLGEVREVGPIDELLAQVLGELHLIIHRGVLLAGELVDGEGAELDEVVLAVVVDVLLVEGHYLLVGRRFHLGALLAAHVAGHELLLLHGPELLESEASLAEVGEELLPIALVAVADDAIDLLVDELRFDGTAELLEVAEDELVLDEGVEGLPLELLEFRLELRGVVPELVADGLDLGDDLVLDLRLGDDLPVDHCCETVERGLGEGRPGGGEKEEGEAAEGGGEIGREGS